MIPCRIQALCCHQWAVWLWWWVQRRTWLIYMLGICFKTFYFTQYWQSIAACIWDIVWGIIRTTKEHLYVCDGYTPWWVWFCIPTPPYRACYGQVRWWGEIGVTWITISGGEILGWISLGIQNTPPKSLGCQKFEGELKIRPQTSPLMLKTTGCRKGKNRRVGKPK